MLQKLRRTRPRTRVVAGILAALVVAAAVYWFGVRGAAAQPATPAATTRSVAASLTTLEKNVTASGTLAPTVQQDVSFAASGSVTAVKVAAGQQVKAGQTLATIDTLTLNADLLSAKATLASARAKLADAKDADDGTDAASAQIVADAAQVDVAVAAVDSATTAMAGATLTAPVAGSLTEVNLTVGQAVTGSGAAGSGAASDPGTSSGSSGTGTSSGTSGGTTTGTTSGTTSSSTAQFVIVGTAAWQVDVTVGDADLALIAAGDQAKITLDGADAAIFGTVAQIGLISTSTGGVAGFPVVIAVTGKPAGLHDGVSADVSIVYERRANVLTAPSAAVRTVDGKSVVSQAGAGDKTVSTEVKVGETVGTSTEITSGLAEGDQVLVTVVRTDSQTGTGTQQRGTGELPSGFPTDFPPAVRDRHRRGGPERSADRGEQRQVARGLGQLDRGARCVDELVRPDVHRGHRRGPYRRAAVRRRVRAGCGDRRETGQGVDGAEFRRARRRLDLDRAGAARREAVDVTVETGAVGVELTEITSGLSAGDRVVLADLGKALAGANDTSSSSGLSGLGGSSTGQTVPGGQPPVGFQRRTGS
ncbi:efflux RND transporter periplasmic adaptor subunit [Pengzhenrongella sp.]|jgi:macrolide-specific efflux system membrane fusion protein|uniref:efflux RND transporter periplasmic adaptor subunit n=1 Tax=Pengzhenrongella sp. TaxID=2888820 RepID=UPI002F92EF8B